MMKPKKKVFVLGSGASKAFCSGFGVGSDLINGIKNRVFGDEFLSKVISHRKELAEYTNQFQDAVDAYVNEMGESSSIDHFININRNKKEPYPEIAKFMIAAHILGYEGASETKHHSNTPYQLFTGESWLGHLYDYILKIGWDSNELDIVTFNYDRLLEQYLCKKVEGQNDLSKLNLFIDRHIYHVYGQVGYLPFQNRSSKTAYAHSNDDHKELIEVQEEFNLMYDDRVKHLDKVQNVIANADDIYSLGYAFDRLNNCNIGLHKIDPGMKLKFNVFDWKEKLNVESVFADYPNCIVTHDESIKFIRRSFK